MANWLESLSNKQKVLLGVGLYFGIPIQIGPIDLSINKAVLYLVLASALTIWVMVYIARRMQMKPNRVQTAVEVAYDLTKNNITGDNLGGACIDGSVAIRWFPFIATLFFFIAFSNLIGYLPLPTNTENEIHIFGLEIPAFVLYAATANISFPLVLTLVVWVTYHVEGVRSHGLSGFAKSYLPAGL